MHSIGQTIIIIIIIIIIVIIIIKTLRNVQQNTVKLHMHENQAAVCDDVDGDRA